MSGTIALVGGDEFRVGCEEMDREVMRRALTNRALTGKGSKGPARVIIIPTAAVTGPAKAANDGVTHFAGLGGAASQLMVLESAHTNDAAFLAPVSDADVVYFTGGSPDHLLATLNESALLRLLTEGLERGLVLGGSSAGAMVMGSVMRRPSSGGWVEGLGIAPNIGVLPHHERRDPAETLTELRQSAPAGVVYLGIDARTGVIGSPGDWQVSGFGKVTVYRPSASSATGDFAVFGAGERLPEGI